MTSLYSWAGPFVLLGQWQRRRSNHRLDGFARACAAAVERLDELEV